ncbi:redoxin domain-containing protein [Pedobacter faecalis]|uniref:redoxin domain-containing protein n=1 Tax=Pedobacter faecalis TaxID=3041495 RepID=UPI00254A0854|nr:TlpA disulfide reductase family protein [Pedobacter sp. ELA7]
MKHYLFAFLISAGFMPALAQQNSFVLNGKIKGQSSGYIKLNYAANGKYLQDSAVINNGSFVFKGSLGEPSMAYIIGPTAGRAMDDPNVGSFFLEPASQTIDLTAGDFKNLKVTGSKTHQEYADLQSKKKAQLDQIAKIGAAYDEANKRYIEARQAGKSETELDALKEKANDIKDQMDPYREAMDKIDMEYIKTRPDSYYSAYALRWRVSGMPLSEGKALYAGLSDRIKATSQGKEIAEELRSLEGGSPGAKANLFRATDINGQQLDLNDYRGKKYILLDFWASWCVPCRKGNPHLLSLYSKYKDKGLEIVGVSDDDSNHEAWKKAVAQDKIGVWRHVLRGLKRVGNDFDRSSDLSDAYAIHSLPTKILIDKNGVIVGRYGGGGENDEAMDKKLAEIFN